MARVEELLEALRAAQLYRAPEDGGAEGSGAGPRGVELDTRSNDYLGLASWLVRCGGDAGNAAASRAGGVADEGMAENGVMQGAGQGQGGRSGAEAHRRPGANGGEGARGAGEVFEALGILSLTPGMAAEATVAGCRPAVSRETVPPLVRSGAGASRLVSGTTAEHGALERELAMWLGTEAALLFSSAYAANVGAMSALALQGDAIFSDELNHASIIDGCRLSRAETVVVPHRDLAALASALARPRPERSVRWVVTESYFSMDGTSPDLAALRSLCDRHEAALVVDETHSLGVFGAEGRGLAAATGVRPDLIVGGLGKALGLQGGFVAGPLAIHQWLWNRARSFVFSTGVSPWLCARARLHLQHVRGAEGARAHLATLSARLQRVLSGAGVPLPAGRHGPLFPIIFGAEAAALAAADHLQRSGVRAQPIRPPTVPRGSARLRVSLRADMTESQVELLGSAVLDAWRAHRLASALVAEPAAHAAQAAPPPERERPASDRASAAASADGAPGIPGQAQRRWIVLGTGTGIGKSYAAQSLVRALAEAGEPVAGLKPVETGCRTSGDGRPREGDAALLEAASRGVKHPRPHPLYGFVEPIAPSLAAYREGQSVDIDAVASWVDRVKGQGPSPGAPALVIETAGGVFSPLSEGATNFELARTLGEACWILVAPDRLGVLHDVTSTLRAMTALGRSPDMLVLSAPSEPDASTGTNAGELRRLGLGMPLLELGRHQPLTLAALCDVGLRLATE